MYTVQYCNTFMDELLDKMGSDYFTLPIKLNRLESITLDFIRETTSFFETTQELSDDIIDWVVSKPRMLKPTKERYMGKLVYKLDYPDDYLRFLNIYPFKTNEVVAFPIPDEVPNPPDNEEPKEEDDTRERRSARVILNGDLDSQPVSNVIKDDLLIKYYRIGHFTQNRNNPHRKALGRQVNVYRMNGGLLIDSDQDFNCVDFSYVRKPVFGKNMQDPIMDNFNDEVINKLLQKTCVSLRATSSDEDSAFMDDYVERQGQKIK